MNILVKVHNNGTLPNILQKGDWIDLHAAEDVELKAPTFNIHTNKIEFQSGFIDLGVSMKLPKGYEAIVAPRSSAFKNKGIIMTNSIGVIDGTFCGDNDVWKFPYVALKDSKINKGERIAQFRIIKSQMQEGICIVQTDKLGEEDRGGIGSTGL